MPGAGIKDVESCRPGCALDSSAVQMQTHPPCADLPALSKIGLTVDMEGVKAWVCGAQARCSQGASSLLAAHELEMSATFVSPNACVQPLNYMSNAATE